MTAKNVKFGQIYDFCDVYDFRKVVAFLGISKFPMANLEIHYFSCYLFKNFCFPLTQIIQGAAKMIRKQESNFWKDCENVIPPQSY